MKYGLIGEKLGHSFSQVIHHKLAGYSYELKELAPNELEDFILSKAYVGINVTIPYKEAVIPLLDEVDESARKIGAVNTISNRDGRLVGYNTDYGGLKALVDYAGIALTDKTVLILGSGGTSKTALAVANDLHCRQAIRVSRSGKDGCITYEQAKGRYATAQFIINTTPCGMYPHIGESAVNVADFPHLEGVIDVVYNPLRSRLVCDALAQNIPAVGGLYMLVAQAALASELFTGVPISKAKIASVYQALLAAKQNVVLIGMPGCGKSTIGKRLARQLELDFFDSDEEIVRREGREIPDLFINFGEAYFRRAESAIIRQLSAGQGIVIATGGGAILNPENIALLRENGRVYFLDRPLECLCATPDRPLSSDRKALEQRYSERYDLYCAACDVHVRADGTMDETIRQIREDLRR